MSTRKIIKLPVSSLAAACGMNQYVEFDEFLKDSWRKNHNLPVANGVKKVLYKKSNEELDKIFEEVVKEKPAENMSRSEKMSAIDKTARVGLKEIEGESKNSTEVKKNIKRTFDKIDKELANSVEGMSRMGDGVKKENSILDDYEKGNVIKITNRNDAFLNLTLEFDDYEVRLCGKVDGMTTDPETGEEKVVEVKSRRNRLFRKPPIYEVVQCMCYMHILKVKSCIHIENYNSLSRTTEIKYDDALWEEIVEKLKNFVECYAIYEEEMKDIH